VGMGVGVAVAVAGVGVLPLEDALHPRSAIAARARNVVRKIDSAPYWMAQCLCSAETKRVHDLLQFRLVTRGGAR
jgi:hypothetical protein